MGNAAMQQHCTWSWTEYAVCFRACSSVTVETLSLVAGLVN